MTFDPYRDVAEFHRKFGLPTAGPGVVPKLTAPSVSLFRTQFLEEELRELRTALDFDDLAGAADALVDLVYVALGTAHLLGLDFPAHWAEVQRANLAKERATSADDPRSKRGHHLDVVKPEGWLPPDHAAILRGQGVP